MEKNLLSGSRQQPPKGNRGKLEIIGDILGVCLSGNAKRTHIMYRGNLSHDMLKVYVDELSGKGLIELTGQKAGFRTTEKGKEFLDHYSKIRELLAAESQPAREPDVQVDHKLATLGLSQEFLKRVKVSSEQALDLMKGITYLNERYSRHNRPAQLSA